MAQAVFIERRRGTDARAWRAAKAVGLALAGFAYLFALVAGLSAVAERLGVL